MTNTQVKLAERPLGQPTKANWLIATETLPELEKGDVLVQVIYISLDPAMRGWMNAAKSYIRPVEIGEVMRAGGAGKVVASENPKFKVGDYVTGSLGVQQYFSAPEGKGLMKVDTTVAPLKTWLGALGMTGMTAYFGLLDVGKPKAGDVVVVSGGAGAVGSLVGQIAKQKGCFVVGIAGGSDKTAYMKNVLGFDEVIDYRLGSVRSALRRSCPDGIDVYFDNVGGEILDVCLSMLRLNARVVICGAISVYNSKENMQGPKNYLSLLVNRARMEGFVVFDYAKRYTEGIKDIAQWMHEGKIKTQDHIVKGGVEDFQDTLMVLFEGDKIGKLSLQIAEE